jgi:hypothetical protein
MPKKLDSIKQSVASALSNAKHSRKAYDRTWSLAARAPIFCKITKKSMGNGRSKKTYRSARLIGRHAYKIAASGAAMNAVRIANQDCSLLRVTPAEENSRAPWLPGVSRGAQMVLEQFLCALSQEAAYRAHAVRQGTSSSQRMNADHMKFGWEATVDSVFGAAAPLPRSMIVLADEAEKKTSKSKASSSKEGEKEEGQKEGKKKKGKKARAEADDDEYAQPEEVDVEGDAADLRPGK